MGIQLFTPQDFQRSTVMFLDRKSDVSINNHPNWVPLQPNGKKAYDHPPKSIIFRTARSAFQIPHDRGNTTRKLRISCDFNDDISENECAFSRRDLRTSYRHHRCEFRANGNFLVFQFFVFYNSNRKIKRSVYLPKAWSKTDGCGLLILLTTNRHWV